MNDSWEEERETLEDYVGSYTDIALHGLQDRLDTFPKEIYSDHIFQCLGGLAARQTTLAIELANAPQIWNGHVAPIILRSMIDAHIMLSWILISANDRASQFISYGLGQEKLFLEHLKNAQSKIDSELSTFEIDRMIELQEGWLNSQIAEWATEVNVGSWSGLSTRDMAIEAELEELYRFAYVPFSAPTHNTWQHVGKYNVSRCTNPLHKFHYVPLVPESHLHPDFAVRSAKYLTLTFKELDKHMGTLSSTPLPLAYTLNHKFFKGTSN